MRTLPVKPLRLAIVAVAALLAACAVPATGPSVGTSDQQSMVPPSATILGSNPPSPAATVAQGPSGRIVFTEGQPDGSAAALVTSNPDGSVLEQILLEDPPELFSFPVWSPDGTRILISHTHRLDGSNGCCLPFRPAIVNPDGSGFTLLPMAYAPPDMDCSVWSSDQTKILCGFGGKQPGVFSVAASDGSDPVRLTTSPYGTSDEGAKELPTAISPDGKRFLFIRFKHGPTDSTGQAALFVENIDGSGLHQVTPLGFIFQHDDQAWASWSPDGRTIISTTSQGRLFTVRPDGTGVSVVDLGIEAPYFAFDPGWSPDGTRIVFAMYANGTVHPDGNSDPGATVNLYTVQPDGRDLVQITNDAQVEHSPDWGGRS
jgi:WD40 repeat protein